MEKSNKLVEGMHSDTLIHTHTLTLTEASFLVAAHLVSTGLFCGVALLLSTGECVYSHGQLDREQVQASLGM